jgi:hypothetical protein
MEVRSVGKGSKAAAFGTPLLEDSRLPPPVLLSPLSSLLSPLFSPGSPLSLFVPPGLVVT